MEDNTQEPEITLDTIMNTGVGADRTPPPSNEPPANDPPAEEDDSKGKPTEDTPPVTPDTGDNRTKVGNLLKSFSNTDELDDTKKPIRDRLLSKFKGTSFDAEGNIVDKEGKVVTSSDDIYKYVTEGEETKDAEGNIVDEEGNIVKSVYDIAVEETVVNKLHDQSPYTFVDENGKPKIYADDEKGFTDFANDVSAQRFEEFKEEYFNRHPLIKDVIQHLTAGHDLSSFKESVDYSTVDPTNLTMDEKIAYIERSFEIRNLPKEQIGDLIQMFKDGNQIDSQLLKALPALQQYEEDRILKREEDYHQAIEEQNKQVMEYWNNVEEVVSTGKLVDLDIPDAEKEDFFSYLSDAIDNQGNSKDMLDARNETLEQKLLASYLRYKGFDLSALVNMKASAKRTQTLKELIAESANLVSAPVNDASKNGVTSREQDITIDALLG